MENFIDGLSQLCFVVIGFCVLGGIVILLNGGHPVDENNIGDIGSV